MSQCTGVFGRLFGHRFVARESMSERHNPAMDSVEEIDIRGPNSRALFERLHRPLQSRVYHGDVCARCGIIVNRSAPSSVSTNGGAGNA